MERLEAQWMMVPEMKALLESRYTILRHVQASGPVGRRKLAEIVGLPEREVRAAVDFLRDTNLIRVEKEGATITTLGFDLLTSLETMMNDYIGRTTIARRIAEHYGIREVRIVDGDSDHSESTKLLIGEQAAHALEQLATSERQIVAVTGGTSVASVPQFLSGHSLVQNYLFIAARGGMGDAIPLQANSIVSTFAKKGNASYRVFFYPDELSERAHKVLQNEKEAKEMMALYEQTDIVIHGIGVAEKLVKWRNSSEEVKEKIKQQEAKSEAFGYYFNASGDVVHRIRTVGIQLEHLREVPHIFALAGGKKKAEAILSYLNIAPSQTVLITDEGAANEMIKQIEFK